MIANIIGGQEGKDDGREICGDAARQLGVMPGRCVRPWTRRGCMVWPASDGSADAMLPAHEAPLPLFPAHPCSSGAKVHERISAQFSFPPQMPRPVCPATGI